MDTINDDKPADSADTTVEEKAEEGTAAEQAAPAAEEPVGASTADEGARNADDADDEDDEDDEDDAAELAAARELAELKAQKVSTSTGVVSGAFALVGVGLALASLTGTWLGTLMADREQLIGQIKAQSASSAAQTLTAEFITPWHTTALFNGLFGLVAVLVAGAVLVNQSVTLKPLAPAWVKAVAWSALALGIVGLLVSGLMFYDVFTPLPHLPPTSTTGSAG